MTLELQRNAAVRLPDGMGAIERKRKWKYNLLRYTTLRYLEAMESIGHQRLENELHKGPGIGMATFEVDDGDHGIERAPKTSPFGEGVQFEERRSGCPAWSEQITPLREETK